MELSRTRGRPGSLSVHPAEKQRCRATSGSIVSENKPDPDWYRSYSLIVPEATGPKSFITVNADSMALPWSLDRRGLSDLQVI